jgi:hypothetical protein
LTDRTERRTVAGFGSDAPLVGAADDGAGAADVRGDELPCGRGEEDVTGADGDALLCPADGEGEPLAEGVAKEISPEEVSWSDVVCP